MDQNTQTAAAIDNRPNGPSNIPPVPETSARTSERKVGPIIAILLGVLVLIIAALYIFASRIDAPVIPEDTVASEGVASVTDDSTEVDAMQRDLDSSTAGLEGQNF